MKLLLFVCRLKAISLAKGRDDLDGWFGTFLMVILAGVALLYGLATGYLFRYLHARQYFAVDWLMVRLALIIGALILLKGYFPENVMFRRVFMRTYPVGLWKKAIIQLCYDLISPFFLLLLLFLAAFYFSSGTVATGYFLYLAGSMLVYHLLERIVKIQQAGTWMFVYSSITLLVTGTIILLTLCLKLPLWVLVIIQLTGLMVLVTLFVSIYQRQEVMDAKQTGQSADSRSKSFGQLIFTAVIRKKTVKTTLLIGILFRLLLSGVLIAAASKNRLPAFKDNYFIWAIVCSPVALFNYVFNNLVGYVPQAYFMIGYVQSPGKLFWAYCRGIGKLLLLDFVVSLLLCWYIAPSANMFVFLLFVYPDSIALGFISSLLLPKKVTKTFDMMGFRSNTSIVAGAILAFLIIGMFMAIKQLSLMLLIQGGFMVAVLLLYLRWHKKGMDKMLQSLAAEVF
ncbi:hypothetical protein ACTJJB_28510 [Chitinophaga sp. 22536]|uniref:hypothetical protein n=1 Tax=unclassified Chitinophaga TaxID=2619133 RepID=UPI003F84DB2A